MKLFSSSDDRETSGSVQPERWAILAVLATFLVGLLALFSLPAERILFNPIVYKETLDEQEVYEEFPSLIGASLMEGGNQVFEGAGDELLDALQAGSYERVLRQVFPEDWVRAQTESLIDQFFAYFNFESEQLTLLVDFRPVRDNLSGSGAQEVAETILQGLPACTQEELVEMGLRALTGQMEDLPLCRPPEQLMDLSILLVQGSLQGTSRLIPEQLDFMDTLRIPIAVAGGRGEQAWARWFGTYRFLRTVSPALPWLALLLLAVTGVLARKTARGPFYWVGLALLLVGGASVVIALLLSLWNQQFIPLVLGRVIGSSWILFHVLVDVVSAVTALYYTQVVLVSFLMAVIGAASVAWALRRRPQAALPGNEEAPPGQ